MDFQMDSVFDEQNNGWQVSLSGEIDIFNSNGLKKQLNDIFEQKAASLFINCKLLEYIDSTALGALVSVLKTVKNAGYEMHLCSVKPNLMRLFRITHLDQVFIIEEGSGDV